jgi:hypothetical protein
MTSTGTTVLEAVGVGTSSFIGILCLLNQVAN